MNNQRLFLVNHYHTDLNLNLHLPKGRKVSIVGCRIPAGGMIDVCARLELDALRARAVVEASPDYVVFYARSRMVELVTEAEAPDSTNVTESSVKSQAEQVRDDMFAALRAEGITPSGLVAGPVDGLSPTQMEKLVDLMVQNATAGQDEPPRGGDPTPEAPAPKLPVVPPSLGPKLAKTLARLEQSDGQDVSAEPDVSSAQAPKEPMLDPNVRETIADTVPSTRWDKDRLLAYALNKGLEVNDTMSKNALLRKIRGA